MNDDRLRADPAVCPAGLEACHQLIATAHCASIRYFAQVDSTNTAALREATAGCAAGELPRLFLADRQLAGRGRLGRRWLADDGTLTLSLLLPVGDSAAHSIADRSVPLVALASGVAVARCIEFLAAPLAARIKWPNDVHVAGGKVAGVLVESIAGHPERLVVGIGLNVATRLQSFAELGQRPGQSLDRVGHGPRQRYHWLPDLVDLLLAAYRQLNSDRQGLLQQLRSRCLLTGRQVGYRLGATEHHGRCLGIADDGGLKVADNGRVGVLRSGEVTILHSDGCQK